jgi:MarR family transcriptional regulator, organic hydroperoxide resistance regulator
MASSGGKTSGGVRADTDLTRDVLAHVHGLVEHFKTYAQALAEELGLSLSQLDALKSLGGEPCSQRELARNLHFDASNVTDIVDRLEARGIVSRVVDPNDRRVRRVVLTDEGQAIRHKVIDRVIDDSPVAKLSPADQRALRDLLAKIADPVPLPE